jgi:hypothetical protein
LGGGDFRRSARSMTRETNAVEPLAFHQVALELSKSHVR